MRPVAHTPHQFKIQRIQVNVLCFLAWTVILLEIILHHNREGGALLLGSRDGEDHVTLSRRKQGEVGVHTPSWLKCA